MNQTRRRKRMQYALLFFLFLCIEIFIAKFVHDRFIRPYVGDILVVITLYFLVKTVIPGKRRLLPLYLFLFASAVECLQYFHIVDLLGLQNFKAARILIGSVFDIKDIVCYGVGCLILFLWENRT